MRETPAVRLPDVSYARSGDVAIAYQVVGAGAPDVVFMRGIAGDLVSTWDQPLLVRHVRGLAECGRVLMLDKRGTGLSDRVREVQSAETTMDDVRAVMDTVGSDRAVLWTGATSTGIGVLFAATYPDRCAGLVLFDPRLKGVRSPDYPWARSTRTYKMAMRTMQAIMSAPPRSLSEVPRETGGPHRVTRAHRGLVYVLSEILGVDPKDVYKAAAHTNAVKCSGNTGLRNSENGKQTLIHCGNKFLRDEIQIYNPKILLALSRDSESALRQLGLKTPIAFVPHPQSWRGRTLATVPKRIRAAREALLLAEG